jgi:DNA polymerase (family 10)
MSLNAELAEILHAMAQILEIKGASVFKAIAFSKASRLLENSAVDLRDAVEKNAVEEIEGVGKSIAQVIYDYVRTGKSADYDELRASVPEGLLPMLAIPGLGPKTIALLWKERGITSVDELSVAIEQNKLDGIKGLGEKKIASIKQGIAIRAEAGKRIGLPDALVVAESLVAELRKHPQVAQLEYAGSLRRRRETIGDIDLIGAVKDPAKAETVTEAFTKLPIVRDVLGQGTTKASIRTTTGLQVDLRIVPKENFGAALLYFTGSKDHNVRIRGLALDQGLTLNEWGLYKLDAYEKARSENKHATKGKAGEVGQPPPIEPVASATEKDVYAALGLAFVEPELREDRGEVQLAAEKKLPKLITSKDLKGDLHSHTTASDGTASIEEMAEAALALGYSYLAVTDHSKSQVVANGLSAERLLKHAEQIRKVGAKLKGITLLAGVECDILVDGRMDYDDDVLKELDWVVGSPHVSLKQEEEKATDRIVRAIENPYVNVIGHPTGRLIGQRNGLPLNWTKVFKACVATGTALEINAGWPRLDISDVVAKAAIAQGIWLTIDTDAHSTEGLSEMPLGLTVARRAGVEAKHVLNAQPLDAIRKFVAAKRR